jgi:hypothetical protein
MANPTISDREILGQAPSGARQHRDGATAVGPERSGNPLTAPAEGSTHLFGKYPN